MQIDNWMQLDAKTLMKNTTRCHLNQFCSSYIRIFVISIRSYKQS